MGSNKSKHMQSKIPLPLVFLFLVNVFVVMAVELLVFYPHPAALTESWLEEYDSAYSNCTIVTNSEAGDFRCWLVKPESGDYVMIPTKYHALFSNRAKIYTDQITSISADTEEQEITVKTGIHSSLVTVRQTPVEGLGTENLERYLYILYHSSGNMRGMTTLYMVIAAILEGLELAIWQLIKGH